MHAQRLTRTGVPLLGAGLVLLAGMVVVALTIPVTGYATVQVWVGVAAVALGPCWAGLVLLRSSRHQAPQRLGLPVGASMVLTATAGLAVRDHHVEHPAAPVTAAAVAYGVIALVSVLLTVLAATMIEPPLTPDELDSRPVDVRDLHTWGKRTAVLGALFAAGLVATSLTASAPDAALFGVMTAGCAVVSGVVLTRVHDLRGAFRSRALVTVLLVVAMFVVAMAWPVVYGMSAESLIGAVLHALQLIAAMFVVALCAFRLVRFLGRYGALPHTRHRPDAEVAR
ncbi:hypothetical protein [Lentzea sp. NEAU-D7]|uniref:hypothetical protein n=1 Tax=Lentzea sp. NEAU-D7 TaxID=2994667 RepID=UPI00224AFC73|nr:hypothetical protein [Lentzea sp. NEAU-D7]MCX2953809.1 hypothetical protein [Lentzea sp. NEAU-D7]